MFFAPLDRPWLRWFALVGLLFLGCLARAGSAHAQDHIVERSWLEDPTGQLGWDGVRQLPTQPFVGTLNRGFGTGVLWLRLRIDPQVAQTPAAQDERLVLRIRPVYLDDVQVFDPLAPGGLAGVVGDHHHPRRDALPATDFLLPIARGEAPRDIWLRLASTSTRQIHVAALPPHELAVKVTQYNLLANIYIGTTLVLVVWGLVSCVLHRESLMGFFALMQLGGALFGLSSLGVLRVFWPQAWSAQALDWLSSACVIGAVGTGLWFHLRFLRGFAPTRWALGLLIAVLALTPINLALLAAGHTMWALQGNMLSILLAPPLFLLAALTARAWQADGDTPPPPLSHRALTAFYALFLAIFVLASTTGLGWLQATEWTIYISQTQGLISSVLLMLMLQMRTHALGQQRQAALLELKKISLQVAHERQMREEIGNLLAMLTHEIKTPLATMHLRLDAQAKGGREIRQAMRDMDAVIERCLQALQLGDGQLAPEIRQHDLVDAVRAAVGSCSQPHRVQTHLPPKLPVQTDPQLLFIVLSNLLENACKYSESDTTIELQVLPQTDPAAPQTVALALSNLPGKAGWPDPEHVFDKYYRSPQAQRQSGTGLGLYLVKSLAHTLGGKIAYAPTDRQVRFVLTLPLPQTA